MPKTSTSFKKGQSGNPDGINAGRKRNTEETKNLQASCKELTMDALDTITSIMFNGENERNKLEAAKYIIERGWGKVKEIIDDPTDKQKEQEKYDGLSPAEQHEMLNNALEKAGFIKK